MKKLFFGILSLALLYSCSADPKTDSTAGTNAEKNKKAECTYAILPQATANVEWTAFKFTEKTGVGGTFDKVRVAGNKNMSTNVTDILNGAQFIILPNSVNSKNPERDAKISEHFFGSMIDANNLSGKIVNAKGTNNVGQCEALLKMNGVEKAVDLAYKISGDQVTLTGKMNVNTWNGQKALSALNGVCDLLHKGADGQSKLWPDVDLKIMTNLKVVCPE